MHLPAYDAFLSYARGDDARADGTPADYNDPADSFVRRLYDALTAAGLRIWWDRVCLPARALSFSQEIRDAINQSARLLLVVGPHSALGGVDAAGQPFGPSEYVQKEIEHAQTYCIAINPILRKGSYEQLARLRPDLSSGDVPNFTDDAHFERSVAQLVRQLQEEVATMGALHGVPLLPTYYIRRAQLLDELERKIRSDADKITVISAQGRPRTPDEQAVAVQGMGGLGKSTLAAALALDCDVRRMFPDGIFWVELKREPNLALRQADLGSRFGDSDAKEYPDAVRGKQRLGALLADKRALIILDDIWKKEDADAFLVPAPRCCFLLTTRLARLATTLGLTKESLVELHTLSEDETIALIEARLGSAPDQRPHFRRIHAALEGHTLAISLAAARLSELGLGEAARYAERLERLIKAAKEGDNPFRTLDMDESDKTLSVAVTLDESYEALSPDLQRRFRLLGIFAPDGTFDDRAAAWVWGDLTLEGQADAETLQEALDTARDALNDLTRAALLTRTEDGRCDQHALLRAHARARMNADERAAAFERYADYVIAAAAQFDRLPMERWGALEDLPPHMLEVGDELSAQWSRTPEPGNPLAERCADFADNVVQYCIVHPNLLFAGNAERPTPQRLRWFEAGIAACAQIERPRQQARLLYYYASLLDRLGDIPGAIAALEQSLSLSQDLNDPREIAVTQGSIADLYVKLGRWDEALALYEQSLATIRQLNDPREIAVTQINLAQHCIARGEQMPRAFAMLWEGCCIIERLGNPREMQTVQQIWQSIRQRLGGAAFDALWADAVRVPQPAWLTSAPSADPQAEFARQLTQLYAQGGADALRGALAAAGIPQEQIEQIIAQVEAAASGQPAGSGTLPDETVNMLCGNTVAVRTSAPDKLDEWKAQLTAIHADWLTRGADWAHEVGFAAALLAVLAGESPVLPPENPYARAVAAVVARLRG